MNSIKHLEWIYDRLVEAHGENPNYDYMHKFKSIIEENNLREAYLLDAVHELAELKVKPLTDNLKTILENNREYLFDIQDFIDGMHKSIDKSKEEIYNKYEVTRQRVGKIESNKL